MAPTFRRGFPATFAFVIVGLILIVLIQLLAVWEHRRAGRIDNSDIKSIEASQSEGKVSDLDEKDVEVNTLSVAR